jgi:hypothetical protein
MSWQEYEVKKFNLYAAGMAILMEGMDLGSKLEPVKMSDDLKRLTPKSQYLTMLDGWEEYSDAITRMNEVVEKMARLYETDTKEMKGRHPLALHYFLGGCDWYISEWDRADSFFGYAILNNDVQMSEWGYISLSELLSIEASLQKRGGACRAIVLNLDYHCPYKTVEEVLFRKNPEYFWKYDPSYFKEEEKKGGQ